MTLYIDYAWTHPNAQAIYDAGYRGVMRYLSNDASKDLSVTEAKALHAAGLGIGLVWETTASRAKAGQAAGAADAKAANAKADALGFPKTCPIFYAVDYDAVVSDITPYFVGIKTVAGRPVGVYGSYYVVKAIMPTYASYGWQTMAWSGGLKFTNAHLYQTLNHTWPIPGIANSAWDENVLLHSFPLWIPTTPQEDTLSAAEVQEIKAYINDFFWEGYPIAGVVHEGVAKKVEAIEKKITALTSSLASTTQRVNDVADGQAQVTTAVAELRDLLETLGGNISTSAAAAMREAIDNVEVTFAAKQATP
jgi:hypothetical protein